MTKGANTVIGEMDRPSAKELLFPNAIYIHLGKQFVVTELDIPNRRAEVIETDVNYFTDAVVKTDLKVLSEDERLPFMADGGAIVLGDILVRTQVSKFKKLRFHTHENIGFGEISLDAEEMDTRALMLLLPDIPDELDETALGEVLTGLGSIIRSVIPFFLLCDRQDIGVAPRVRDPHFGCAALYVYDRAPGGSGLSEALADKLRDVFSAAAERVHACTCETGCPSCIGVDAAIAETKARTMRLLEVLSEK